HYVTFDIGFTLFFFLSYICLLKILEISNHTEDIQKQESQRKDDENQTRSTITLYILLGLCIGLGLASKVSFIPFYFLSAVFLVIIIKQKRTLNVLWQRKYTIFLTVLIALCTLWATYFFKSDLIIAARS